MSKTLQQGNHKLGSACECREAIAAAKADDPVTIDRSGKLLRFIDAHGRLLGTLTSRHSVARELDAGNSLLHCCVSWTYGAGGKYPGGLISVRVVTGDPDDTYGQWCVREVWGKPREARPVQAYAVNVSGETFYQDAIRRCRVGNGAVLYREPDNPHDPRAIVVKMLDGSTIGYVPKTSWLQRVVHEEGLGAEVTIQALHPGPPMAVILAVAVSAGPVDECRYSASPGDAAPPGGWLTRLLGK
jgi:hypothetical protein